MGYKLELDHPDYEKGVEVDFGGVAVENGGSKTLTEEDEQRVVATHGKPLKDALGGSKFLKISGSSDMKKADVEALTEGGGEG
jgi:hypothetical protein